MSLFKPSFFKSSAVFLCLVVAACGFQPMYGSHGASKVVTASNESQVEIANIPDRDGQYLRNQLIDRLYLNGRPAEAPYVLTIQPLKSNLTNLGIRKDATSTRGMLQLDTTITLVERATGNVVLKRDERAVGGYNELDNQFATLVSAQSLTDHMLEEISDSVVTDLNLYFTRKAKGTTP